MEKLMYKRFHPVLVNPQEKQLDYVLKSTPGQVMLPGLYCLHSPSRRFKPYVEVLQDGEDIHGILWQKDNISCNRTNLGDVEPGKPTYICSSFIYKKRRVLIITGVVYVEKDPSLFRSLTAKILSIG